MRSIVVFISLIGLVSFSTYQGASASDRQFPERSEKGSSFARLTTPQEFRILEDFRQRLERFPLDQPTGYAEWQARTETAGPFQWRPVRKVQPIQFVNPGCRLAVIVNALIIDSLEVALDLYLLDVAGEGFAATVYAVSGGTPEDMRAFLQERRAAGMDGCLLIGDFPVPWYEMTACFEPGWYEEFPCDLFYMDLDGTFADLDSDGLYDQHTGLTAPDIWFGRLTGSSLTFGDAGEVDLLRNYFDKNHRYRCGLAPLAARALVYTDDDWTYRSDFLEEMIVTALSENTCESDPWVTTGTDYEQRVSNPHQFVQVWVHSNWTRHNFVNPDSNVDCTYNWELPQLDPSAYFYNLCGCFNAFYTEADYIAGWYVFNPTYGLAAVSSTKAGEMMYFQDYFPSLGEQKTIGRAFLDWFQAQAAGSFWTWEACFYYGMTLLGDPTLTLPQKSPFRQLRYDNEWGGTGLELPNAYDIDLPNNRFTVDRSGTLARILFLVSYSNEPTCRVYIWNSNGSFPTSVVDSVDVALETINSSYWTVVDVLDKNITFSAGDNFHVGLSVVAPQPGQFMTLHGSEWTDTIAVRSSVNRYGTWMMFPDIASGAHNFDLRAVILEDPVPTLEITTLTLPTANLGGLYQRTLEVAGGVSPYVWEVTAGGLVDGISLDAVTGVISGVATTIDTAHFTVAVSDQSVEPLTDFQHLTLAVQVCVDSDGDGFGDPGQVTNGCPDDNCPSTHNPGQEDANGDGVGDACCCGLNSGSYTGNTNCSLDGLRNLADISRLIDHLFISKASLCCENEGNTNGSVDGKITLSDITALIDHVYISKSELAPCQ